MNAKDLMIGDIVTATVEIYNENTDEEHTEQHPLRITDVSSTSSLVLDNNEVDYIGDFIDDCDAESFSDIAPIPLTEKILNANGWTGDDDNFELENCPVKIKIVDKYGSEKYAAYFHYVHELQHALRLCGRGDLADNFKIEQSNG